VHLLATAAAASNMHTGSCMPVRSCMRACHLLLMRACVWRAYSKKCRVHLALERVVRSNIHVLIQTPSEHTGCNSVCSLCNASNNQWWHMSSEVTGHPVRITNS
jgi:hypothetical protein